MGAQISLEKDATSIVNRKKQSKEGGKREIKCSLGGPPTKPKDRDPFSLTGKTQTKKKRAKKNKKKTPADRTKPGAGNQTAALENDAGMPRKRKNGEKMGRRKKK